MQLPVATSQHDWSWIDPNTVPLKLAKAQILKIIEIHLHYMREHVCELGVCRK